MYRIEDVSKPSKCPAITGKRRRATLRNTQRIEESSTKRRQKVINDFK
jgi:hypothetical protein